MLESLSRSRTGMRVALGVGRAVPRRAASRIVSFVADRMLAENGSDLVRAARSNQHVASGGVLTGEALETAVRKNVHHMARYLYDLYHVIGDDAAEEALLVHDEVWEAFLERHRTGGPFVYVGAHMGNFDLVGRGLGRGGWLPQVLSVPEPNGGYQWQNDMRERVGFEVTPISLESLRAASRRLESGHSVLTGHDRPLEVPDKVRPRFFGRPASLPLLHVRLAMRAGVPVIPLTGRYLSDGRYRLLAGEPVVMRGDRPTPEALLENAEACLRPVERWITEYPAQWSMPHVVWPDVTVPD